MYRCLLLHTYVLNNIQFKFKLTTTMIIDFFGCWLIEMGCKLLFANLEPKRMIVVGRERRDRRRAENGNLQHSKAE